jgi:hypothetical protein
VIAENCCFRKAETARGTAIALSRFAGVARLRLNSDPRLRASFSSLSVSRAERKTSSYRCNTSGHSFGGKFVGSSRLAR